MAANAAYVELRRVVEEDSCQSAYGLWVGMPSLDECTGERRTKVTGTGLEPRGWGGLVGKGFDRGQSVSDEAANGRTVVFSGMRTLADL